MQCANVRCLLLAIFVFPCARLASSKDVRGRGVWAVVVGCGGVSLYAVRSLPCSEAHVRRDV